MKSSWESYITISKASCGRLILIPGGKDTYGVAFDGKNPVLLSAGRISTPSLVCILWCDHVHVFRGRFTGSDIFWRIHG